MAEAIGPYVRTVRVQRTGPQAPKACVFDWLGGI